MSKLDDLLEPFHEAIKPKSAFRIGTEAEKFGISLSDGSPIPFEGPRGVRAILAELADRHAWTEEAEYEGGEVIALKRAQASITLEPGGQLELSGAPQENMHQTCAEFRGHMAELREISDQFGVAWLGLGFHPFAKPADLPWVPKLRYGIMRKYLPTVGSRALDMMQRTATVQANYDYDSEDDAMRKLRISLMLAPVTTAMFANSPFMEGRRAKELSHRAWVWLDVDNNRSGLLPFAWEKSARFTNYIDWALDVPMFMVKRGSDVIHNTGQTFRSFMKDGFQGHRATKLDWETHINTLFPEVRLKRTIEVRGADGQQTALLCALPSLWTGIFYDEQALGKAEALASKLNFPAVNAARSDIAEHALRAELQGREVGEWASELLAVAMDGLHRRAILSRDGADETVHLAKLQALVAKGQTPADALVEGIDPAKDLYTQVMQKGLV
ncbi:MAG: glutamate--cysteine ligase [Sandaracinaceae bacterium]|nr:glutamate--cysteine ligase [Sandaracinaceae bacterium]